MFSVRNFLNKKKLSTQFINYSNENDKEKWDYFKSLNYIYKKKSSNSKVYGILSIQHLGNDKIRSKNKCLRKKREMFG